MEAKIVIINFVSLFNDESTLTLLPCDSIARIFHHPKLRYAENSVEVKLNLSPENVEEWCGEVINTTSRCH